MPILCGIKLDEDYQFKRGQVSSYIGRRFKTTKSGVFQVIEGDYSKVRIRFDDTRNERVVLIDSVYKKSAWDLYAPNIFKVACKGASVKTDYPREYSVWYGMISRCYNKKDPNYPAYGQLGVSVNVRWTCFEYFLEDYKKLKVVAPDGYAGVLELDKDLMQLGVPLKNKVYSRHTCLLVSKSINNLSKQSSRFFTATHEDGHTEAVSTVSLFTRIHSETNRSGIGECLRNTSKRKQHKGWTFQNVEPTFTDIVHIASELHKLEEKE